MKQRILINIHYLEIGGAEASLIGLLNSLDPQQVEVDLMLNDSRGELLKYVPDWVNILEMPKDYSMIEHPISEVLKKGYLKIAFARLWAKYKFNKYVKKKKPKDGNAVFGYVGRYVTMVLPDLNYLGEYDLAVSFLAPHDIVLRKIRTKKKVCWIHTDYASIDVDRRLEYPVWNGYDKVVSISDKVTQNFCQIFPELKDKIVKIEPILSTRLIEARSREFVPTDMTKRKNEFVFLSVGRYCYAKNFESIPEICREIHKKGINLRWYIIGYGGSDDYIRREIKRNKMEDFVILLGKKENPYPYIKMCDWYVQPSRFEGNSLTVKEAQILCKPVIIVDYPTASSQIQNRVDGWIVDSSPGKMADQISDCLLDGSTKEEITRFLEYRRNIHSDALSQFNVLLK